MDGRLFYFKIQKLFLHDTLKIISILKCLSLVSSSRSWLEGKVIVAGSD
jgi:hypothetical protein